MKFFKITALGRILCRRSESAEAAGFFLSEQSVSALGTAFAFKYRRRRRCYYCLH